MILKLTHRYARALLEYAEEHGLEEIYRQALTLVLGGVPAEQESPEPLGEFLSHIPGGGEEKTAVLYAFLDLARERMNLLKTEIISAVPLRTDQLAKLEERLILMFHKQLDITTTVDRSLLGGLRIIVDNTVLDDTIKRKMMDMKERIYEGVYWANEAGPGQDRLHN